MIPSNYQPKSQGKRSEKMTPAVSLAGLMAPLHCAIHTIDDVTELHITGISMDQTLVLLATSGNDQANVVMGFKTNVDLPPIETHRARKQKIHESQEMLDQLAWLVLLDGDVELSDAEAIQNAWECGDCLLNAELRATTSVVAKANGTLILRSTNQDQLLMVVGELLRNYVAEQRGHPSTALARPELGLINALLSISGTISIRPLETQIYSTWADIGINTCPNRSIRPADHSIIYDNIGNSWHADV